MTENEVRELIRRVRSNKYLMRSETDYITKALEEVQQYRAIGTLEELITAMKYVRLAKAHRTVGRAIEECAKYEEIGTPEECRAAVEKQTAKKVKSISQVKDGGIYVGLIGRCPCCGDILEEDTVYCDCGQRLDWSNEE